MSRGAGAAGGCATDRDGNCAGCGGEDGGGGGGDIRPGGRGVEVSGAETGSDSAPCRMFALQQVCLAGSFRREQGGARHAARGLQRA